MLLTDAEYPELLGWMDALLLGSGMLLQECAAVWKRSFMRKSGDIIDRRRPDYTRLDGRESAVCTSARRTKPFKLGAFTKAEAPRTTDQSSRELDATCAAPVCQEAEVSN